MKRLNTYILPLLAIAVTASVCGAGPFVAYSLKESERQLKAGKRNDQLVVELGGITDIAGLVYDPATADVIIVGQINEGRPKIVLDDLVVAMRSVLVHHEYPLVSIDKTPQTPETKMQKVRFEGGIERTHLGATMLEADVVLKKLALDLLPGQLWGVDSYVAMSVQEAERVEDDDHIASRFWFKCDAPALAARDDVFAIMELGVSVETEVLAAEIDGKPVDDLSSIEDEIGTRFARQMEASLDDLATQYPVLGHARSILALVALVQGMETLGIRPELQYWLREHSVGRSDTPGEFSLLQVQREVKGRDMIMSVSGGFEINPMVVRLQSGEVGALKEAVLTSRPADNTLVWHPPLDGWQIPGTPELAVPSTASSSSADSACMLERQLQPREWDSLSLRPVRFTETFPAPEAKLSAVRLMDALPRQSFSTDIGGVMLSGMAQIEGAERAEVSLAGGNFSLVVDGRNARIDPRLFRKFVTALWCVYYSEQAPGISIDPPARDPDEEVSREEFMKPEKHSVRYIGRVVHTDLGRVMREADYLMKKWAVGSGRPDYPGFRSVDGYSANLGVENVGVSRRFWFVPEDLRFRRGGDLLLFDAGRMRLLTEYDRDGMRGRASQADEAFASFFTEHYDGIGKTVPVYEELFEYAKLVSLAKYLKQQGVPLHWFLMANKDLVLMEDSPTEVDAFIKRSDYVRGIAMKGGVDLASTPSFRNDAAAEAAIRRALACVPAAAGHGGPAFGSVPASIVPRNVSFEVAGEDYTVLPQHSLTSGKDHRGIRYQTDAALRGAGKPALELVRYFNPRRRESGQFGRGWHLLIPYRVEPVDGRTRPFLNVEIPERMAVENVLSGEQEVLAFSEGRDEAAGYVPQKPGASQIVKLYLMSDGSHRLADKLGNQFHFDPSGRMREMFLSPAPEHQMSVEYMDWFTATFVEPAYCARPVGEERVDFLNARIPRRVEVRDCVNDHVEELTFSADNEIPGYVPDDARASRFRVAALLANGGLEVRDQHGNRIRLTPGWDFDSILPAPERQMVRSVSMGGRRVTFGYTLDAQGQVVIATATVAGDARRAGSTWIVRYEYDDDGRLCRVRRPAGLSRPVLSAIHQEAAPKQAEQLARLERGRPDRMIPAGPETLAP